MVGFWALSDAGKVLGLDAIGRENWNVSGKKMGVVNPKSTSNSEFLKTEIRVGIPKILGQVVFSDSRAVRGDDCVSVGDWTMRSPRSL